MSLLFSFCNLLELTRKILALRCLSYKLLFKYLQVHTHLS